MSTTARDHFRDDWLSLREPADHRARAESLLAPLREWLAPNSSITVVDLGAGRGSNLQYLAPRLKSLQRWVLLDHDPELLAQAQARPCPQSIIQLQTQQVDLRQAQAWQPYCAGVHLMTASALIDIVSAEWLHSWATFGATQGSAFLVALSVDGHWQCSPEHPDDTWVQGLFNAHQQAAGAFGGSLGPAASSEMASLLRAHGYRVTLAESPWQLEPHQQALQTQLLQGWAHAAREQAPTATARIDAWQQLRQGWIEQAQSRLRVGHTDLLAVPG